MGKKVSDLVLCFSSSFAYSEAAEVWPIYTRRIVPSNGRLMWLVYCKRKAGRIHSTDPRLHIVGTIRKKLSKFYTLLRVLVTLERIKYSLYRND